MSEEGKTYLEHNGKFYVAKDGVTINIQQVGPTKFVFVSGLDPVKPGQAYEDPKIEELIDDGWVEECDPPDTPDERRKTALLKIHATICNNNLGPLGRTEEIKRILRGLMENGDLT